MVGLTRNSSPSSLKEDLELFIVKRKQWNAHPPLENMNEMYHPIPRIFFTHTETPECTTFDECKRILKKIQFEHMDTLGHKDIRHNFMIGGAGWIFEGRGWNIEPDMPPLHTEQGKQSLQIAYIGDFQDDAPPSHLMKAAMEILVYAVRKRIMFHFYAAAHLN